MRKKIAAGNWKMNCTIEQANSLAEAIIANDAPSEVHTILCVPYVYLDRMNHKINAQSNVSIAAQNVHHKTSGAYTGEISVEMLASLAIKYVVIGHSERREYFYETNEILLEKTKLALSAGIEPIFCCGESLDIRKSGAHLEYVIEQLRATVLTLDEASFKKVIIAYEPIWAIGTGETASPEQAQEMHESIRQEIEKVYGSEIAQNTSILYGGSVKGSNAKEIFAKKDVDGGLVGGASLNAEEFIMIMNSFEV
ncbi:MAG TPA: triose-phosphate isomerase [Saprospiraceae bacterium]|nr:triose-phosphate isomerase [Saprospiraceae bacterium]